MKRLGTSRLAASGLGPLALAVGQVGGRATRTGVLPGRSGAAYLGSLLFAADDLVLCPPNPCTGGSVTATLSLFPPVPF